MPSHDPDDLRVGDLLSRAEASRARVVILGFPSDEGVRRNGGRVGAADAPVAIRTEFRRLTPGPHERLRHLIEHTLDLGDLAVSGDVERDQEALSAAVAPHLARGTMVVVLGGGHETTYGHFLAYAALGRRVSILNWDAHPDVRPLIGGLGHSGSPFRQAISHPSGLCEHYIVAGLQPQRVAAAHAAYVATSGGTVRWRDDLDVSRVDRVYDDLAGDALVSFDVDAVDASAAPGVSAPATNGLTTAEWLAAARAAGRCPHTRSIDLVEVNPRVDIDGRTARLAALTLWTFLAGLAERER